MQKKIIKLNKKKNLKKIHKKKTLIILYIY